MKREEARAGGKNDRERERGTRKLFRDHHMQSMACALGGGEGCSEAWAKQLSEEAAEA